MSAIWGSICCSLLRLLRRLVPICYRMLCDYLYNLSEIFSKFYSNPECKVIGSDKETSRLLLCEATAVDMRKCFNLLGITPIYKI
ncbi:hypothetical protein ES288_D02G112400v1 [Gossypium darwinii]|uniref:arginine--tRNA ligase n=1 Tax=Gossypium darwinii TaxID=34276 RepID=A0A5D2DEI2_GOSDA|nr:hypothetical protein ES288_D02G112400v1 [Gossypium darwinii]